MSFSMSSRFSENTIYTPSPTTYKIPSPFDEKNPINCHAWTKSPIVGHKCDGLCTNICSRNIRDMDGMIPKKSPIVGHKCDGLCSNICNRNIKDMDSMIPKKQSCTKRHFLEPSSKKLANSDTRSTEEIPEKASPFVKKRLSLHLPTNKENLSPQRNNESHIPRFKKKTTEGHYPAFVTRPRTIHNCLTGIVENHISPPTSNFDRHALQRKSVKPVKKNGKNTDYPKEDSLEKRHSLNEEESGLPKRPFNKSYTILVETEECTFPNRPFNKSYTILSRNGQVATTASSATGAIPKTMNITDDMKGIDGKSQPLKRYKSTNDNSKYGHQNFDSESCCPSKVVKKDDELTKELTNNWTSRKYYSFAAEHNNMSVDSKHEQQNVSKEVGKTEMQTMTEKLQSRDVFALDDCNVIFLVAEEFIDDEYDSYVNGLNKVEGHLQVVQNNDLYEMTKSLVRLYLEKYNTSRKVKPLPNTSKANGTKLEQTIRRKFGKLFNKRKKHGVIGKKNIWNEIEIIVRAAIMELKDEFQKEIYNKTNEKVDQLVSQLIATVLKANDDIGNVCERTTLNLISRLENIALKS